MNAELDASRTKNFAKTLVSSFPPTVQGSTLKGYQNPPLTNFFSIHEIFGGMKDLFTCRATVFGNVVLF